MDTVFENEAAFGIVDATAFTAGEQVIGYDLGPLRSFEQTEVGAPTRWAPGARIYVRSLFDRGSQEISLTLDCLPHDFGIEFFEHVGLQGL